MIPVIFSVFLAIGLLIATYRDVRTREVPDTVSYGLIIIGLFGGIIGGLVLHDLAFFLEHLYGFIAGIALGMLMFYTRQWGGGDAKLIMGVGAIIGLSRSNLLLVEFVILLILCGAAYGVFYTLYLAFIRHRKVFMPAFRTHIRTKAVHRLRIGLVATGIIFLILFAIVPWDLKVMLGFLLFAIYLLVYSWIFMQVVERSIMVKEYPVAKLTEGDWIVGEVRSGKRVLVPARSTGITLAQIAALKKAKIKSVKVKEGIPFVPGFLLAYVALLVIVAYAGETALLALF